MINLGVKRRFSDLNRKNVVAGLGEIGRPILKLISQTVPAVGYDINERLVDKRKFERFENFPTSLLHICIPFSEHFVKDVISLYKRFTPQCIVIHSTLSPGTTKKIQSMLPSPIIYSPTRGIHKRMLFDLKRYTKFYAIESNIPKATWAASTFTNLMKKCGIKTRKMSTTTTLELAKIVVDTSYYGWLINYAQLSNMLAIKHNVDYDEIWSFADEIHKFLGNRPKLFPGFIGGHCLDGDEIIYIKTQNGMRPITIRDYVESNYQNDVLSYDIKQKKPIFDKVTLRWKRRFSGKMVTLVSRTNRSITTTGEHLMICSENLSERLAKDVSVNDTIPFVADLPDVKIKETFDFETKNWRLKYNMPDLIAITPDFCRLLGYYTAEGSVTNYGKGYSVRFSFNKNESKYIDDVYSILENIGINHYKYSQNNVTHVGAKSTPLALFISDTLCCGRSSSQKHVPEFIYFASRRYKEEFLAGYLSGDGCFMPKIRMVSSGTSSEMLAAGLDLLLLSMGYVMTISQNIHIPSTIEGRTISGNLLYSLASKMQIQYNALADIAEFDQFNQRTHSKQLWHVLNDNLYMIRTTKTIHEEREQDVYSIDTKNHLFVSTSGRLVHNCVIPNLDLLKDDILNLIREINSDYAKFLSQKKSGIKSLKQK